MNLADIVKNIDWGHEAQSMYDLMVRLYPFCRSISGNGVRKTLRIIEEYFPLSIKEVPSGKKVFDWTVPKEWNIRDAYVKNANGERIIDFNDSNLHVVGYSVPVNRKMTLAELKPHLHTLPNYPEWIPYRTSYYDETWGFCISQRQLSQLKEDELYDVCIDASLENGYLTYGEFFKAGRTPDEVLLSCHTCHPSLCNDNLSGIVLVTYLAQLLNKASLDKSYRILLIPGTIGSITWLSLNEDRANRIKHGLVLSGVGDPGVITYKKSRQGTADIDRIVAYVLDQSQDDHRLVDFSPYGYDERQYCSPGFNLPVGCLQRTPFGEYPEYHTSADSLLFVQPEQLADTLLKCLTILDIIEHNRLYVSTNPKCEPQLGKRGLYNAIGGGNNSEADQMALLWVLNLSDGRHSLIDIAQRSRLAFDIVKRSANILAEKGLLVERSDQTGKTVSNENHFDF